MRCASYSAAVLNFEDIPSPKGLPFVGSVFSLLAAGGPPKFHEYLDKRHKELGPIFKDKVGPISAVFLSDCDEMRAVFAQEAAVLNFEDIPSPRGLPFVGSTFTLLASGEQLHEYLDKRHKELGPIFKDKIGPLSAVFLSDPDEMRAVFAQEGKYPLHMHPDPWLIYNKKRNYTRGLIFMDGEEWLHFRRIMNKLLLKDDLSWVKSSCDVAADIFLNRLLFQNEEGREFPNLEQELYKWSMDTIVSILLGADEYRQNHKVIEPLVKELASTVHLVFENTVKLMLLPARLADQFNIPRWRRFESSVDTTFEFGQ
ncbi:hypothetical protein NQ314_013512 [Rhamnusium bicolor]|uniref:Cytochrome P450 n=1 Tax=Rhamnusium bicolor TaxID=1586634 RepID=A0AAV8X5K8_9CUCU|nr:hypothetical protein NQ314_013512 [Rhamnusium bicolor]